MGVKINKFGGRNIHQYKDLKKDKVRDVFNIENKLVPNHIANKFDKFSNNLTQKTRQSDLHRMPLITYDPARKSIIYHGPKMWSSLP